MANSNKVQTKVQTKSQNTSRKTGRASKKAGRKRSKRLRWLLGRLGLVLLAIICIALFYIIAILSEPVSDGLEEDYLVREELTPQSPIHIYSFSDINEIVNGFPAPILVLSNEMGIAFTEGTCHDMAHQGGFGRVVTLHYTAPEGYNIILQSIYPNGAFDLLSQNGPELALSTVLSGTLAGVPAVRMESNEYLRLHAQGKEAIYSLLVPLIDGVTDGAVLAQLGKSTGTVSVSGTEY